MKNKAGNFVAPTMESFEAAAANADWLKVQNFAIDLNDQPGAKSWPIESATFVLLPTDPADPKQSAAVKKFFDWGFAWRRHRDGGCCTSRCRPAVQDAIRSAWQRSCRATM